MNKSKILNTIYIDNYLKENRISKKEFCRRCGISYYILKRIYAQKNMSIIAPLKVVDFLNISMDKFLYIDIKKTRNS